VCVCVLVIQLQYAELLDVCAVCFVCFVASQSRSAIIFYLAFFSNSSHKLLLFKAAPSSLSVQIN